MKHIQVFTQDDTYCEVNGVLISDEVKDGLYIVKSKEDACEEADDKTVWIHKFPLSHLRMVRISEINLDD